MPIKAASAHSRTGPITTFRRSIRTRALSMQGAARENGARFDARFEAQGRVRAGWPMSATSCQFGTPAAAIGPRGEKGGGIALALRVVQRRGPMLELLPPYREPTTAEDHRFDEVFPAPMQRLSSVHWTPVAVARRAAALLVDSPTTTVLDVGAGVGKFCIVGAKSTPGRFVGIERHEFCARMGQRAIEHYAVARAEVLHGEALNVDWREFDGIYLFNPFNDPAPNERAIRMAEKKLEETRPGTRVVTYHGFGGIMPPCFRRIASESSGSGRLEMFVRLNDRPRERKPRSALQDISPCLE